jgi:hypothetical protein
VKCRNELPGKEWCRLARLYQAGYRVLATLELETARGRLLAERSHVLARMTDEVLQREIKALGREAVRALSDDVLCPEIERRRALPSG